MNEQKIPKVIHLCWFGGGDYPVEVKACLDSWKRVLPDYKVRVWNYDDARALGIRYVDEALEQKKWAFASDVVRFYAVYAEGGVYMDSDIYLFSRFDDIICCGADFVTFHEKCNLAQTEFDLQAAMFMGVKGNRFCEEMLEHYRNERFVNSDGSYNLTISPARMREIAIGHGYRSDDRRLDLDVLTVFPTHRLKPRKRYPRAADCIGEHRVVGSWRDRKLSRRITRWFEHQWRVVKYNILHR